MKNIMIDDDSFSFLLKKEEIEEWDWKKTQEISTQIKKKKKKKEKEKKSFLLSSSFLF
jgi:hypothetical protein